jgi:chromosome segregation ATPase
MVKSTEVSKAINDIDVAVDYITNVSKAATDTQKKQIADLAETAKRKLAENSKSKPKFREGELFDINIESKTSVDEIIDPVIKAVDKIAVGKVEEVIIEAPIDVEKIKTVVNNVINPVDAVLTAENIKLDADNKQLRTDKTVLENNLNKSITENKKSITEYKKLSKQYNESKSEITRLESKITKLTDNKNKLIKNINNKLIKNKDQTREITRLETQITTLESKITRLESKITRLESKITRLESKITTLDVEKTTLDVEKTTLESKITQLETQITQLDVEKTTLESKITQLDVDNKEKIDKLETDLKQKEKEFKEKNEELGQLNTKYTKLNELHKKTIQDVAELEKQHKTLKENNDKLSEELNKKIQDLESKETSNITTITDQKTSIDKLEETIKNLNDNIDLLKQEMLDKNKEISDLTGDNVILNQQIEELKKTETKNTEEIKQKQGIIDKNNENIKKLSEDNVNLQKEIKDLSDAKTSIASTESDLKKQQQIHDEIVKQLGQSLEKIRKHEKQLEQENIKLTEENKILKEEYDKISDVLNKIISELNQYLGIKFIGVEDIIGKIKEIKEEAKKAEQITLHDVGQFKDELSGILKNVTGVVKSFTDEKNILYSNVESLLDKLIVEYNSSTKANDIIAKYDNKPLLKLIGDLDNKINTTSDISEESKLLLEKGIIEGYIVLIELKKELKTSINNGNIETFKKLSERIIIELKGKFNKLPILETKLSETIGDMKVKHEKYSKNIVKYAQSMILYYRGIQDALKYDKLDDPSIYDNMVVTIDQEIKELSDINDSKDADKEEKQINKSKDVINEINKLIVYISRDLVRKLDVKNKEIINLKSNIPIDDGKRESEKKISEENILSEKTKGFIIDLRKKNEQLNDEINKLKPLVLLKQELEQNLLELRTKLGDANEQNSELKILNKELETKLNEKINEVNQLQEKLKLANDNNILLKEKLSDTDSKLVESEKNREAELKSYQDQVLIFNDTLQKLKLLYEQTLEKNTKLKVENDDLKEEIKLLTSSVGNKSDPTKSKIPILSKRSKSVPRSVTGGNESDDYTYIVTAIPTSLSAATFDWFGFGGLIILFLLFLIFYFGSQIYCSCNKTRNMRTLSSKYENKYLVY